MLVLGLIVAPLLICKFLNAIRTAPPFFKASKQSYAHFHCLLLDVAKMLPERTSIKCQLEARDPTSTEVHRTPSKEIFQQVSMFIAAANL